MKNKWLALVAIVVALAMAGTTAAAQDAPRPKPIESYKVTYTISELESGKAVNQRQFSMDVRDDGRNSSIRAGNRVPIVTQLPADKGGAPAVQYMDVGFSADATLSERDSRLLLDSHLDMSSLLPQESGGSGAAGNPVTRATRLDIRTLVEPDKKAVISSMDDMASKKTMQLEVVVTKISK